MYLVFTPILTHLLHSRDIPCSTLPPVFVLLLSIDHIVRHRKIKGEANPYDPQWEIYFEQRLGLKMLDTLQGRRQLRRLWIEQDGLCPVCQQKITELTGWHNRHIVWRSHGGTDTIDNRVLLHPICHRQVHTQGLSVVKPRSETSV